MKLTHLTIAVCCTLVFTMCTTQEKQPTLGNSDIIEFNFDTLTNEKILFSNLFDSVTIIPLETNDSCLMDYPSVKIIRDTIYIKTSKKILQFNIKGEFIRQIGKQGKGPGEYGYIDSYWIEENSNSIYIQSNSIYICYNTKGEYKKDIKAPIMSMYFAIQNNKIYTSNIPYQNDSNFLSTYDINGTLIKKQFHTDKYSRGYNAPIVYGSGLSSYNEQIIFSKRLFDTIYQISNNTITPKIVLKSKNFIS